MAWIDVKNLISKYKRYSGETGQMEENTALADVSLSIERGDFVGILGRNGSGKSTLARHLAALLLPGQGQVWVGGLTSSDPESVVAIRKMAGLIFQNPDNQIIGNLVEEEVAFGPENLGLPPDEIDRRITRVLETTGMQAYRLASPNALSGGQKQKIAISGVLAMEPECIIFDEPTAMIDPESRDELLKAVYELNKKKKITIIYITHFFEEVENADYLYLMDGGKVADMGNPREFTDSPQRLKALGIGLPFSALLKEEFGEEDTGEHFFGISGQEPREEGLRFQDVSFRYADQEEAGFALLHVDLTVRPGEFTAIIGPTGSGKSTLIKHMNALLTPTEGKIFFRGKDVSEAGFSKKELRTRVGLCFQIPDYQLFEETVIGDIAFGPSNMGFPKEECLAKARRAMELMGLPKDLEGVSPFSLSGGQKRRVAIAGILAMEPDYLVLDEPGAGMDWEGRKALYETLHTLNEENGITILVVSHNMNEVAEHARRLIVMREGQICMDGTPREVFSRREEIKACGLKLPDAAAWYLEHLDEFREHDSVGEGQYLPVTVRELARLLKECGVKEIS